MTSFKALEQSGWTKKASAYDEHFAMMADQAIEPILDCVGDVARRDVLDICCGTGNLVRAVAARGGRVTGIDFAPTRSRSPARRLLGPTFRSATRRRSSFQIKASTLPCAPSVCGICPSRMWRWKRQRVSSRQTAYTHTQPGCCRSKVGICLISS